LIRIVALARKQKLPRYAEFTDPRLKARPQRAIPYNNKNGLWKVRTYFRGGLDQDGRTFFCRQSSNGPDNKSATLAYLISKPGLDSGTVRRYAIRYYAHSLSRARMPNSFGDRAGYGGDLVKEPKQIAIEAGVSVH
jgi:hypothetical protein